jgi:hypothetical protein
MKFNRKMVLISFDRYKELTEKLSSGNKVKEEAPLSDSLPDLSREESEELKTSPVPGFSSPNEQFLVNSDTSSALSTLDKEDSYLPVSPAEFFKDCLKDGNIDDEKCVKGKKRKKTLGKNPLALSMKETAWITLN